MTRTGRCTTLVLGLAAICFQSGAQPASRIPAPSHPQAMERQITSGQRGRILTNIGAWSPDGQWLVHDTRSDPAGSVFDGETIEVIHVETGEVREVFRARHGARCGVATFHPAHPRVVFILGPENPTPDWQYGPFHRRGVVAELSEPGRVRSLDARDLVPPFTPGALRGGSHVHAWDATGDWLSFTYEDHILATATPTAGAEPNRRTIAISAPLQSVPVPNSHPRNQSGEWFTVVAVQTVPSPRPGSDEIARACEEGWIGTAGYVKADGSRQRRALAFQGEVLSGSGERLQEVFVVDLPEDITRPGAGPLEGTATTMPYPPLGTTQRRLTRTADRKHPGLQGPRHWLRASPDGRWIACLMKDDNGVAQIWLVSAAEGSLRQLTHNDWPVSSAFTWSPDGRWIAHIMDRSVCATEVATGQTRRLTPPTAESEAPRPEACVFSPDGRRIAFVRHRREDGRGSNQVCVVEGLGLGGVTP